MDGLLGLFKDYQIGTWCKRAAWIILALDFVRLLLQCYQVVFTGGTHPPLLLSEVWNTLLQALLSFASGSLFSFFLLYAVGVAVERFVAREK